jgi:ribosomal protein S18 acetylase RimI-like enzyme
VALDGERVVGFVTFGPQEPLGDPAVGELYAIYVDPGHWDSGYGRALFTAAERGLRDVGYAEAVLWVLATNARARRFYEIAGWAADGGTKVDHRGDLELREVRYRRAL